MARQPTEKDIDDFKLLCPDVQRSEIIARLKGNNNNVDQALNEYFDSPEESRIKYRYDESLFHTDREGVANSLGVSFQVQGPDDYGPAGPSLRFDGAPSRPPSRVNNKSPKVIDLTSDSGSGPLNSLSFDDQDKELQQALAASRVDAGMPPQESGITGTENIHFGPANRNQYEKDQWAMVPLGSSSVREILLDPEPADRKRDISVPAFLKPSIEDHRLGALITIYHEIPMTREIFLNRREVLSSYGYDPEWWTGKTIQLAGSPEDIGNFEPRVDHELQRLMAFLSRTDRSYGSVEALVNCGGVQRKFAESNGIEAAVWQAWRDVSPDNHGRIAKVFSRGVPNEAQDTPEEGQEFAILELFLPRKSSSKETLYDIADEVLWPRLGSSELSQSPYLSHVGEVVAFKIDGPEYYKQIEIPEIWYPDRYLFENREAAWKMRMAKKEVVAGLELIQATEHKLKEFQTRTGKTVKVQDMLRAALRHDEAEIPENKQGNEDENPDTEMLGSQPSRTSTLSAKLQRVIDSIDRKLIGLSEEREKAIQSLRDLSKLYTLPSDDSKSPKLSRYSLRGVSTTKSTTYICRRAEPDLIDMDLDNDGSKNAGDQWWKINFATSGNNPITVEKTTLEQVLLAAKTESKKTILVYASDKAMDWENRPLPGPLATFVKWDNDAFKSEFPVSEDAQSVSSPGKRKRLESRDSSPANQEPVVREREVRRSDEPSEGWVKATQATPRSVEQVIPGGTENHEIIDGIDPTVMTSFDEQFKAGGNQEMQERGGVSILAGLRTGSPTENTGTIDSMDLDRVVEDAHLAEESPAVKHVDFRNE